jgi:dTDP-4-dehydrorhamnose reductase
MIGLGRILIVGFAGQVGRELQRSFAGAGELICRDRESVDLAIEDQVREMVRSAEPDLILNAAAYTAVDRAESEPELAMAINSTASRVLAEEASRRNILLVHYSTDYVFDGTKQGPWVETDPPNPINVYGASKLAGERAIQLVGGKYLIFRTSWVYGPHGNNFLLTMLRLGRERPQLNIVDDQIGAPTTSIELANATRAIVDGATAGRFGAPHDWAGVYNMTCSGSTSWFGFARAIFEKTTHLRDGQSPEISPIQSSDYPTPAKRPLNSVLSNLRLNERFQTKLPPWESALESTLGQLQPTEREERVDGLGK